MTHKLILALLLLIAFPAVSANTTSAPLEAADSTASTVFSDSLKAAELR